ncbi:MAG: O-antigen ligase family protein [Patescibacteria group bacterium]
MSNVRLVQSIRLLLLAAVFMPLFVGLKHYSFPFIVPKVLFFRSLVDISFLFYVWLIARDQSYLPKKHPLIIASSLFIAVSFLSSIFGVDWHNSWWGDFERMEGLFTLLHFYVYFLMLVAVFRTKADWVWLFRVSCAAGMLVIGAGIIQRFSPEGHPFLTLSSQARVFGTLGNYIYFGHYSMMMFWISTLLFVYDSEGQKRRIKQYMYGAAGLLSVLGIFLSGSRGPLLAWIASIMAGGMLVGIATRRRSLRAGIVGILALIVIGIGSVIILPNSPLSSIGVLGGLHDIATQGGTAETRLLAWNIAWKGFIDRPVFGWGWFNYYAVFNRHYDPQFLLHSWSETWFDHSHNQYMDMLATGGAIGFVSYLSLFAVPLWMMGKKKQWKEPGKRWVRIPLLAALIGYGVNNLFVFDYASGFLLLWVILAFIVFADGNADQHESRFDRQGRVSVSIRFVSVLLGAVTMFFFYRGNVLAYSVNRGHIALKRQFFQNPAAVIPQMVEFANKKHPQARDVRNDVAFMINSLERVPPGAPGFDAYRDAVRQGAAILEENLREFPLDVRRWLLLTQLYRDLYFSGDDVGNRMEEIFQFILPLSPRRQQIHLYWSELELLQGNYEEAVARAKHAVDLEPAAFEGYWFLAKVEASEGHWQAAREWYNEAVAHGFTPDERQQEQIKIILEQTNE